LICCMEAVTMALLSQDGKYFDGFTQLGVRHSNWVTRREVDLNAAKGDYEHQAWQISLVSKGIVTIVNAAASSYIVVPKGILFIS